MRYLATGRVGSLTLLQVTAQQQEAGSFRARSRAREPGWCRASHTGVLGTPRPRSPERRLAKGGEVSPARWPGSFTVSPRKHGRGEDAARSGEEGLTCCSFSLCFSPHRKERPDRAGGEERNQAETHEEGAVVRAPRFLTPKGAEAAERKAGRVAGVGACRGRSVTLSTASWATPSSRPRTLESRGHSPRRGPLGAAGACGWHFISGRPGVDGAFSL